MNRREEWKDRIRLARYDALLDGEEWDGVTDVLRDLCARAYCEGVTDALGEVSARYPQVKGAAVIAIYEAVVAWLGEEEEEEGR